MKIEDCKTVNEFFGVEKKGSIWIEGKMFTVYTTYITDDLSTIEQDGKALVGCLTGQLKWSKHEPITEGEKKILREIAAWLPDYDNLLMLTANGTIKSTRDGQYGESPFGSGDDGSKAYEVLAPILEKYGEIDLDDYRNTETEEEEPPFGSCDFCGYEFNSELINEYEITHCPKCGEEIEESIDLGW